MKKEWLFVLICHIVNWLVFSATDYLAEEWDAGMPMFILLYGVAFFNLAVYIVRDVKCKKGRCATAKEMLIFSAEWLGIGSVLGCVICLLVFRNKWIVLQAVGGFENFLNGIEYALFGIGLVPAAWVFVLIWNLCRFVYYRTGKRRIPIK